VSGGYVYAFSVNNDGIDSNRNLYFKGGTTYAYGTTQPECGIDAAEGYSVYISGGTLMAVGGGESYPASSSSQPSIVYGGTVNSGATITISNGSSEVASYVMGRSYSGTVSFLLSAPGLTRAAATPLLSTAPPWAPSRRWHRPTRASAPRPAAWAAAIVRADDGSSHPPPHPATRQTRPTPMRHAMHRGCRVPCLHHSLRTHTHGTKEPTPTIKHTSLRYHTNTAYGKISTRQQGKPHLPRTMAAALPGPGSQPILPHHVRLTAGVPME
jgi:hypothetical protein